MSDRGTTRAIRGATLAEMAEARLDLPGGELVARGIADLRANTESVEALLVAIGRPRLLALGLDVPECPDEPDHRLYRLLAADDPDTAHGRYNALVRKLVSFERALACAA